MKEKELIDIWKREESVAHIHGWDFSHIEGKYTEETDLPWNYQNIILDYLKPEMKLLDIDTGGGEFLLSLRHPYVKTSATEAYPPNIQLCKETLLPLGIDFRAGDGKDMLPFDDYEFDIVINRHGDFNTKERFCDVGFDILDAQECFRPIKFFDIGALVWFAHIIEWEFPNFSVDNCKNRLLYAQQILEQNGCIEGKIHRFLLVLRKAK